MRIFYAEIQLTVFDKLCIAFWTADLDTSFTFWDTYLLFACRTFENAMSLALRHKIFLFIEPAADSSCFT